MWYKEWTTVRFKFYLWLGVFGVLGLTQVTAWSPFNGYYEAIRKTGDYPDLIWYTPLFKNWIGVSATATFFCALLGGADLVSEEVDKGTLSFLLTRPISRKRIYAIKILTNLGAFVAAAGSVTLAVLLYDQLQPKAINFGEGLGYAGLVLLEGVGIICLSGLVSVFTRNVLQTLGVTVAILILLFGFWSLLIIKPSSELLVSIFIREDVANNTVYLIAPVEVVVALILTVVLTLIASVILALYWAGMLFFARKEF